jgi:uncharacterized protein YjiS (DUF1127 family)
MASAKLRRLDPGRSADVARRVARELDAFWASTFGTLRRWRCRQRARQELARVSERDLRDAGVSPLMASWEASRPFWRPLRPLRD